MAGVQKIDATDLKLNSNMIGEGALYIWRRELFARGEEVSDRNQNLGRQMVESGISKLQGYLFFYDYTLPANIDYPFSNAYEICFLSVIDF